MSQVLSQAKRNDTKSDLSGYSYLHWKKAWKENDLVLQKGVQRLKQGKMLWTELCPLKIRVLKP